MPALDTNVLVRYLVQDEPAQFADAQKLIERCVSQGQTLFVPVTVVLELEWVLRSAYGFTKEAVLLTLSHLFSASELAVESEHALEIALHLFRNHSADFADCLHTALAIRAAAQPLWTFDKAAAKVSGAQLVPKA